MKTLRRIFNTISSILMVIALTGCASLEGAFVSCLEGLKGMLETPPPVQEDVVVEKPETLELLFPEDRFLSTEDTSTYLDCFAIVNGVLANSNIYDIEWRIDGEVSPNKSEMYTFAPSIEEKTVTVEVVLSYYEETGEVDENGDKIQDVTTLTQSANFVYYNPFTATARCKEENGAYTYYFDSLGENKVVEWFVNGEFKSNDETFSITPQFGGYYNVQAKVNGKFVTVNNGNLTISGNQFIGDIQVDIDSYYPLVRVSFDADPSAEYKIKRICKSSEKEYTVQGNEAFFEYDDFLGELQNGSTVDVKIKTVNDGVYTDTEYAYGVRFTLKTNEYFTKSYGLGNAYITDKQDFFEQFDYMMLTRENPQAGSSTIMERDFYFAYNVTDIGALVDEAFNACGYTGSYKIGGRKIISSSSGSYYKVSIQFNTVNVPSVPSSINVPSTSAYSLNINAYPLAISETGRASSALPIDAKMKIEVTNTDQLYRLAEMGYCPEPQSGSLTQTVWQNAREVVSLITDETMGEYEIALAIYDWIMYKNNYNNAVLSLNTSNAVQHPAFYLEGLMYASNYGYAVCDGISKAYSLMCNIAGVECMRVVGQANSGTTWGGHAWNKVKVDGNWYIVDATWGDLTMGISYKTGGIFGSTYTDYYEMAMHNYFLVTDTFVANNHKEDLANYYPKTAPVAYNHFARQSFTFDGVTVDGYLNESGSALKNKLDIVAKSIVADVTAKNRKQQVVVGDTTKSSYYFFYELGYSSLSKNDIVSYMSENSSFARILKNNNSYGFSLFEIDGSIGILVSYYYEGRLPSTSLRFI